MPQMINYGGELIRISPKDSKKLEYSKSNGLSWNVRCGGSGNYGNGGNGGYSYEDLLHFFDLL